MSQKIKDYLHMYYGGEALYARPSGIKAEKIDAFMLKHLEQFPGSYDLVKPLLRPLSDIKKKEAREYASFYMNYIGDEVPVHVDLGKGDVKIIVGDEENHCAVLWPLGPHGHKPESLRYLLSRHFDIFNLIPEGLALDKTKHSKIKEQEIA